jgi:hypothetical protein
MPITWTIDSAKRFAVLSVIDPYTIEEWRAAMLETFEDAAFRQYSTLLVDRRGSKPPTRSFVEAMTQFFASHKDQIAARTAIVVRDDAGFGMGRMTELKSELETPGTTIRTFRTYDDAVRWLMA